jgi:hypothetical protein
MDVVIPYKPRPHQREIHANLKRNNVLVCHRRFGKTVTAINQLIKGCTTCGLERPRFAYIAPLYKQAKAVAWDYLCHYSAPIPGCQVNQSELRIDYPNGGRVMLLGADNPDSIRGIYLDGVVVDEVAQCPASLYGEVLRPALSDRKGWVLFIGTPKGHDHFYDLYRKATQRATWYSRMFRASETGILDDEELEQAAMEMSENEYKQEFECDFDISSSFILIPIQKIESAFNRDEPGDKAEKIIGMDVGMSLGGDPSAYVIRGGRKTTAANEIRLDNTMAIAGWFREAFEKNKCDRGFVDSIGYGAGVAHTMQGWGMPVTPVHVGESADKKDQFANKKAELWWRAKDYFEKDEPHITDKPIFRKMGVELSTPEYGYTTSGKVKVQGKGDLLKKGVASPNLADAFCLTFSNPGNFAGMDLS